VVVLKSANSDVVWCVDLGPGECDREVSSAGEVCVEMAHEKPRQILSSDQATTKSRLPHYFVDLWLRWISTCLIDMHLAVSLHTERMQYSIHE
jgi:hypothetical protein